VIALPAWGEGSMDATILDQGLDSQIVSDEEAVAERSDKDATSMDLMEDDFFGAPG
jgi:hypothetical protein